jgi:hypothetical protein
MSKDGTRTTTDAGRPVGDNQDSLTVGPRGPVVFERYAALREDGARQPRAHPRARRARQGLGRPRLLHLHQSRPAGLHDREAVLRGRKVDADIPALLDRRRSPRSGRTKTTRWSTSGSSCWTAIP